MDSTEPLFKSPYTGDMLTGLDVVNEKALHMACRTYVCTILGIEKPNISIYIGDGSAGSNPGVVFKALDLFTSISEFPKELVNLFKDHFNIYYNSWISMIGYNTPFQFNQPTAEELGDWLIMFNSLGELLSIIETKFCWNNEYTLLLYGTNSKDVILKLQDFSIKFIYITKKDLEQYSEELYFDGAGAFTRVDKDESNRIFYELKNANDFSLALELLNVDDRNGEFYWYSNID